MFGSAESERPTLTNREIIVSNVFVKYYTHFAGNLVSFLTLQLL